MPKHAVGSETNTVAGFAECFSNAGNDAKLAATVDITPARRRIAFALGDWFQWEDVADRRNDLGFGDDLLVGPLPLRIEWHEFNEANSDAAFAAEAGEVDDFVIIHAAHHDAVDLHRCEACAHCGIDAFKHLVEFISTSDLFKTFSLQRIERNVDALKSGRHQSRRQISERCAIRRERQIDSERRQLFDQYREVRSNGRLSTRQTNSVEPETLHTNSRHPSEFLVGEEIFASHPVEAFGGHAVGAAKIATISHRDTKVTMDAAEPVDERCWFGSHSERLRAKQADAHGGASFERVAVGKLGQRVGCSHCRHVV